MSFLQSSQWNFTSGLHNPEAFNNENNIRKTSYDLSNLSTRKDSTDSIDLKFRYKTQVCKYWINGEHCPFQSFCSFAHGFIERREREDLPSKYKTKFCKNFVNNSSCMYGTRCQFLHPKKIQEQIQKNTKYNKLLNLAQQELTLFFAYSKRLTLFSELTDCQIMKDLLGQNYTEENGFSMIARFMSKGKPRFYSI